MAHINLSPQETKLATLSVSDINRHVRLLLEGNGDILVLGELSNFTKASSGHLYFTLKDEKAQLRCAFFRNAQQWKSGNFQDGQQVIAKGRLSLYEPRGDYQLIVQELTEAGLGALYQKFEDLKKKLHLEGLFETSRKKSLPRFPQKIGIITSLSGAALQDILTTLKRRYPIASLYIYPSEVQGKNAAQLLIKALARANLDKAVDVLILARGGGSMEDLWPFNDEKLAYALSLSTIPIVSGVGHETDFTISDFVADKRAATPTAAAETVTPDKEDLIFLLKQIEERLHSLISAKFKHEKNTLLQHCARLIAPKQMIFARAQTIDYLEKQAKNALKLQLHHQLKQVATLSLRLKTINPELRLKQDKAYLNQLINQLNTLILSKWTFVKQQYLQTTATMSALSPLKTLERGFSIATIHGKVLYDAKQVKMNDEIHLQMAKGELNLKVVSLKT